MTSKTLVVGGTGPTGPAIVAGLEARGHVEQALEDPFDYENEDRLISWWKSATATPPDLVWETPPGYGLSYAGPGASYQRPDTRI